MEYLKAILKVSFDRHEKVTVYLETGGRVTWYVSAVTKNWAMVGSAKIEYVDMQEVVVHGPTRGMVGKY